LKPFLRTFASVLLALVVFTVLCGFALTKYRSMAITNSTIDSTTIGATSPSAGAFTTLSSTQPVTLGGRLTENAGVINSGVGLKHVRVASCTAIGSGGFCPTTVTWPSAWADTNYTEVCSVENTAVLYVVGITSKSTTSISVIVEV